ncbi:TRAP transporter substrate-binding protein [Acidihalobacter ferrooxydans]|uniref:C4-dicarboxylate ABC transporter substrate-binding protein n=1 Tax=Acidihalobacter ferrooxydans TaxID=1765967 RepID=A0A1P8UJ06_9GAMM|nr:TRAP transporter substrate-binding protein [Acidihalobacter ferrooxydans]APZ43761.1 C4-dicarboxylate ABC transporter substrate-binding protein [Acidihalobacter ferrooxydans]
MKNSLFAILVTTALASTCAVSAGHASELFVVGSWSMQELHKKFEVPFWTQDLPAESNGQIKVKMTTFNQMGIKGSDVFRLLRNGVFDVGMTVADYEVGDAPALAGVDIPLLTPTLKQERRMIKAAFPLVNTVMKDRFHAKVLAIVPYGPQVLFCKGNIHSLSDLKGKKIRGAGRMTTDFLESLGATGVNIPFSEVPGALQRGVIDCAITGPLAAYTAGWYQVTNTLYPIPLGGWDPVITAINLDAWNKLSPRQQHLITTKIKTQFEDPAWQYVGTSTNQSIACLTGQGICVLGKPAHMKLVKVTQADLSKARQILINQVLPSWEHRVGKKWVERWNQSVGKAVDIRLSRN